MKHGTIAMVDGAPAIRIRDTSESKLYDIRAKSLRTGRVYRKELARIETDGRDVHIRVLGFDEGEDVIFTLTEITADELGAWFASDDETGFRQWRQGAKVEEPSAEVTVPDVDHEQDQQDHEPDPEPDVSRNEPETDQDDTSVEAVELTDLQRSIMRCLSIENGSVADISETMGKTTNSEKVQIRKAVHELCDMGLVLKVGTVTQNGRPAMIWGVR